MDFFLPIERGLWVATLVAQALLVMRILEQRLLGRYPFFAAYMASETILSVFLMQLDVESRAYAQAFGLYTVVIVMLRVGVAWELYQRIFEHFPGSGGFRFGLAGTLIVIGFFASMTVFHPTPEWEFPQTLAVLIKRFQSDIFAAVFVFAWIVLRYILRIERPFRPNVLNHWRIATAYFGVSGVASLLVLVTGGGTVVFPINTGMLALDLICLSLWLRVMRRSGESEPWNARLTPEETKNIQRHHDELTDLLTSLPRELASRSSLPTVGLSIRSRVRR